MSAEATGFYVTGGTLRQAGARSAGPVPGPSYVERQADKDLYEGLQRGEFCYVLTSRQMGKSSLMVHTAARLREAGVAVVVLDLTAVGQNLSAEQWYGGLLRRVGRQLDPGGDLEEALDELWFAQEARVGPLERWMAALQNIVLPRVGVRSSVLGVGEADSSSTGPNTEHPTPNTERLVIFLDEIDAVRSLPFSTDEFFAAIRECYNRRAQDREFERLTFCLLGVATPSDLIQDTRTTPFNIGTRIDLTDFTAAEAAPLAQGLAVGEGPLLARKRERAKARKEREDERPEAAATTAAPAGVSPLSRFRSFALSCRRKLSRATQARGEREALLQRILYWTGGHPYLTQRLCQAVARDESVTDAGGVDEQCEALFLSAEARERDDNLLFVRERLLKSEADLASLLDLYGQVRRGQRVRLDDTNPLLDLLRLSGITRVTDGHLRVRNRIYERVFDRAWVTQHMPDAELSLSISGAIRAI